MENSREVPQKIKNKTTIRFSIPTSGYASNGIEIRIFEELSVLSCSLQHYSQELEHRSNLAAH
jgi:hypothetical protein